jgi:hypothetical protein
VYDPPKKPFSWHRPAASSPSAACKTKRCARCSRNSAAARCRGSSGGFARNGLIKKASHCYKYYLTALGKQVVALGLKLEELVIIPELAATPSC